MLVSIIGSILLSLFALSIIIFPKFYLHLGDMIRIKGEREYTSYAIFFTRISGFLFIFLAIAMTVQAYNEENKTYEIVFNVEDDLSVFDSVVVSEGDSIDLSEYIPTKEGYRFIGWTETSYFFVSSMSNPTVLSFLDDIYIPEKDMEITAVFVVIED